MHHPTDDDIAELILLGEDTQYLVGGFEVCPKTGTPHVQCYCYFKNTRSGNRFSEYFTKKHHIEKAKGSPEQNRDYCFKINQDSSIEPNSDVYEVGSLPVMGKITMAHLQEAMMNPKGNIQVFHTYRKTYDELLNIDRKSSRTTTNFFVVGENSFADESFVAKISDYLDIPDTEVAIVTDLSELELYNSYNTIVLTHLSILDHQRMKLWFRGMPIYYNYGYLKKIICPDNFVVVSDNVNHNVFTGFKVVDFWDINLTEYD